MVALMRRVKAALLSFQAAEEKISDLDRRQEEARRRIRALHAEAELARQRRRQR